MKKIKLTILLCLVFVLAITAVACGNESPTTEGTTEATAADTTPLGTTNGGTETTPSATTTTPATTTPAVPETFTSIKIGETPLSEYTIVYAQSKYQSYVNNESTKEFFPVYDFDHETANRLSDLIFSLSGIRLNVVEDKATEETANEILIGKTNRKAVSQITLAYLKTDEFLITVKDTKLAICGGEYGTTWHAIDYLEELFSEQLNAGKDEYVFAANYSYKGLYHLIGIGCIGDSITEGANATDRALLSYSGQLARYLWKDAVVKNFGKSGATMRSDLGDAYTKQQAYTNALNAAAEMDIFTIMLGTNDSDRDRAWNNSDTEKYNQSCLDIMKALTDKNKDLKFVLANCPAYFGGGVYGSKMIRFVQDKLIDIVNDAGYPTTFFDMYSVTKDMKEYFPDGLHPDNTGHILMAQAFLTHLNTLIYPSEAK